MLLIHTQKLTPRIDYSFKHICTRILGVKVKFTSVIEEFISFDGPKLSYGKQPMGNEFFIQSFGLLTETGFEDQDIQVQSWENTSCFFAVSDKSALPFDIFSAAFYLLSRYEEYVPHLKDELRRFPATESLAFQKGFLHEPVVDIWAYKFKTALEEHFTTLDFSTNSFQVHHLLDASEPFKYAQRGFLRNFAGYANDLIKLRIKELYRRTKVLLRLRKDPSDQFTWVINTSRTTGTALTVFFMLGEGYTFTQDFNSKRKRIRSLMKFVSDYHEIGLTFSFHSLDDYEKLKQEKKEMEELTHRSLNVSLNNQFLANLPHSYRNLLELEIASDCTMCYPNHLGFRAGTCTPFLFYDLDYEIKTPLIVRPVAGRTSSLEGRSDGEKDAEIQKVLLATKAVNGTFSLFFSNTDLTAEKKNKIWRRVFTEIQ